MRNASIYSLLEETEYFEMYSQVSEVAIFDEIIKHPEYINQWLNWSEDKQSSPGWYFKKSDGCKYIVGYFSAKEKLNPTEYLDIKEACSTFIKREIEEIRKN